MAGRARYILGQPKPTPEPHEATSVPCAPRREGDACSKPSSVLHSTLAGRGGDKASGGWPVSFGGAALHSSPVLRACGLVVFDKSRRRPVVDAGIIGTCHASAAAHHACDGPGTGRRWRQARALSCGQEPSPSPSPSPSLLTARSGTFAVVFVCSGRSRTAGGVVSASGTVPHHTRTDNFVTPPTEGSRVECAVFARWRGIIHGWES